MDGRTFIIDMYGQAALTYMNMQYGYEWNTAWTCSMEIQHRHPAWKCSKNIQHGPATRTCNRDMQHGNSAWTIGHAAWSSSMEMYCSMEEHGQAACACMDMQHGRDWACEKQYRHAAWTRSINLKHGLEARICSIDMQHEHAVITTRRN
jgi:hypothetical protein